MIQEQEERYGDSKAKWAVHGLAPMRKSYGVTITDENLPTIRESLEPVEKVEFIIKTDTVICNVCLNQPAMNEYHKWVHKTFPASIPIIEFMMNGGLEDVKHWPEGRLEK